MPAIVRTVTALGGVHGVAVDGDGLVSVRCRCGGGGGARVARAVGTRVAAGVGGAAAACRERDREGGRRREGQQLGYGLHLLPVFLSFESVGAGRTRIHRESDFSGGRSSKARGDRGQGCKLRGHLRSRHPGLFPNRTRSARLCAETEPCGALWFPFRTRWANRRRRSADQILSLHGEGCGSFACQGVFSPFRGSSDARDSATVINHPFPSMGIIRVMCPS